MSAGCAGFSRRVSGRFMPPKKQRKTASPDHLRCHTFSYPKRAFNASEIAIFLPVLCKILAFHNRGLRVRARHFVGTPGGPLAAHIAPG
jgi:hypothetical protein